MEKRVFQLWLICVHHIIPYGYTEIPFMTLKEKMITKISLMFRLLKIVHVRYVDENCDRCKYFDDGEI